MFRSSILPKLDLPKVASVFAKYCLADLRVKLAAFDHGDAPREKVGTKRVICSEKNSLWTKNSKGTIKRRFGPERRRRIEVEMIKARFEIDRLPSELNEGGQDTVLHREEGATKVGELEF
jgi:hypothetical protein